MCLDLVVLFGVWICVGFVRCFEIWLLGEFVCLVLRWWGWVYVVVGWCLIVLGGFECLFVCFWWLGVNDGCWFGFVGCFVVVWWCFGWGLLWVLFGSDVCDCCC